MAATVGDVLDDVTCKSSIVGPQSMPPFDELSFYRNELHLNQTEENLFMTALQRVRCPWYKFISRL
jgi:hypothetical protein